MLKDIILIVNLFGRQLGYVSMDATAIRCPDTADGWWLHGNPKGKPAYKNVLRPLTDQVMLYTGDNSLPVSVPPTRLACCRFSAMGLKLY